MKETSFVPDTNARKEKIKKNISKKKKKEEKKREEKKRKRGLKGVHPETGRKIKFFKRNVKRNRNEIEAPKKNQILSPQQKEKGKEKKGKKEEKKEKKKKEHERK